MTTSGEADFLRVASRRCEERPAVVCEDAAPWQAAGAETLSLQSLSEVTATGSLVLAVDWTSIDDDERSALVARAWDCMRPGATLVLLSPNLFAVRESKGLPSRRGLLRLLRPHGRVRKWKDQPFRYLAVSTLKRGEGSADIDAEDLRRLEVTAALCQGRVLELGCGRGELAGLLIDRGHELTGCDLSARKIEVATARHPAGRFLCADILGLELPAASFDTVLLPEVLEHVDRPAGVQLLEKAWSFVAPGGRLVVTVPNEDCIPHANHLTEFDRDSLAEALRPFGEPVFSVDQPYKWLMASVDRG